MQLKGTKNRGGIGKNSWKGQAGKVGGLQTVTEKLQRMFINIHALKKEGSD